MIISVAVTFPIPGTDDGLIYPSNATFTKEHLINSPFVELIMAEEKGQNLTWTRRDLLLGSIAKMLDITKKMKEGNHPLYLAVFALQITISSNCLIFSSYEFLTIRKPINLQYISEMYLIN
jgi:hypothetical protein